MTDRIYYLPIFRRLWRYARTSTRDGEIYSVRNSWVLLRRAGTIELTDGTKLPFDASTKSDVVRVMMFALDYGAHFGEGDAEWRLDIPAHLLRTPDGIRFLLESLNPGIFAETFLDQIHFVDFDLTGKVVVEGGAYVGDTALYYAQRGATVHSFEPDPRTFALAERNIALNPELSGRIHLHNWAIGKDGEISFPMAKGDSGSSSVHDTAPEYARVRSVSVQTILKECGIERPYLLHLDIKGEEAMVLGDAAVSAFERVRVEYSPYLLAKTVHQPTLRELLDRLRELGFAQVRVFKHIRSRFSLEKYGTIDAKKVSPP